MDRLQPAQRGACALQARLLRLLPRESERSGAIACAHTRKPAACWRLRLARGSTVLHRRREASRWCNALPKGMDRLQPTRRGACALQARLLRLLPREIKRSGAIACAHTRKRVVREAAAVTSEHGFLPKERALSLVQCPSIGHGTTATSGGAARSRGERACCASSRERASAVSQSRVCTRANRPCIRCRGWHVAAQPCTEG